MSVCSMGAPRGKQGRVNNGTREIKESRSHHRRGAGAGRRQLGLVVAIMDGTREIACSLIAVDSCADAGTHPAHRSAGSGRGRDEAPACGHPIVP